MAANPTAMPAATALAAPTNGSILNIATPNVTRSVWPRVGYNSLQPVMYPQRHDLMAINGVYLPELGPVMGLQVRKLGVSTCSKGCWIRFDSDPIGTMIISNAILQRQHRNRIVAFFAN